MASDSYLKKLMNRTGDLVNPGLLKTMNRNLAITATVLTTVLILQLALVHPEKRAVEDALKLKTSSSANEEAVSTTDEKRPYSAYKSDIGGKQLFSAAPLRGKGTGPAAGEASIKNLALVGILAGDKPQAILEEKDSKKTHYLSKGQTLGGISVQDVQDNAVILEYNGVIETLTL